MGWFWLIHSTSRSKITVSAALISWCLSTSWKFFSSIFFISSIGITPKWWQINSNTFVHISVSSYLSAFSNAFTQLSIVKWFSQNVQHCLTSAMSSRFDAAATISSTFPFVISMSPVYMKSMTLLNVVPSMPSRIISLLEPSLKLGRESKYLLDATKMLRWARNLQLHRAKQNRAMKSNAFENLPNRTKHIYFCWLMPATRVTSHKGSKLATLFNIFSMYMYLSGTDIFISFSVSQLQSTMNEWIRWRRIALSSVKYQYIILTSGTPMIPSNEWCQLEFMEFYAKQIRNYKMVLIGEGGSFRCFRCEFCFYENVDCLRFWIGFASHFFFSKFGQIPNIGAELSICHLLIAISICWHA